MGKDIDELKKELKRLLIQDLSLEDIEPEDIEDDTPLFGDEGVGLDSLDGVELVVMLQRNYGLEVKEMQKGMEIFQTINTLADYVMENAEKYPSNS
ncbi:MAG: phosphopantetheine-binding protein [Candidatus Brocadiia bacterium]